MASQFDRESAVDDELAARRAPEHTQQRQLELERQRDWGPEID